MTRFFIYAFYSVLSFLFFIPFLSIGAQVDPSDPTLSQEERTKIIERQEDRWQISKSSSNFQSFGFSILKPFVQTFSTNSDSILNTENVRLKIPYGAFSNIKNLTVKITALTKHVDFLFAGVPTQIGSNDSRNILLESTGMFYLAFFNEDGKRIEPKKNLTVEVSPLADPNGSNVYRFSKDTWEFVSSNQEPPSRPSTNPDREVSEGISFQIYSKINASGWWNFDIPKPEYTCITGKLKTNQPKDFTVQAVGVDYFGTSYSSVDSSGIFRLNVLKNQNIKVIATQISKKKNGFKEIGFLPTLKTQNKTAFSSEVPSACQSVSDISIFSIPESIFSNRIEFLKAIDMPDI
ncbi:MULTISPECIES: hypothetical protein [Leptospira]|uniref:hypothetical protein n=1 Tax=Leptospira TaxID=171 RepID=UPI0002BD6531|nr:MULTISPECIES: hypothetical protein [Leptospira]EMK02653.1 hypothetical protein LEP1GSC166_2620 [Leptospira kirschneri]KXZ21442.1 hypothetical protein AYB32_07060 [Leptospira kirschneri]KXZ25865.1 hypothetical protein AYB34_05945 [Leptospira sp. ZV016]